VDGAKRRADRATHTQFPGYIPLLAIVCIVTLHWTQFLALFGVGPEVADYTLRGKVEQSSRSTILPGYSQYYTVVLIPYVEELLSRLRATSRAISAT